MFSSCVLLNGGETVAQDCTTCDSDIALTAIEAECLSERMEQYLEEAELADPVLIDLGACSVPASPDAGPTRGDPDIFSIPAGSASCIGQSCGEPARFVMLSKRQLRCLAEVLPTLPAGEDGVVRYDFAECS